MYNLHVYATMPIARAMSISRGLHVEVESASTAHISNRIGLSYCEIECVCGW